ncbi:MULTISPECIES: hypothetical protein [unclassified Janthinobacterium]|uniref:hypothetical protein n=1 Tax=unclassified Janthinobacterium TaxID=2610881 RepID=UPI0003468EB5|nr:MULTISPECIES: hypothetical protein [unclassified Janthinobacterium]MEC5164262.1 hypothetical protein [Janthinobacterium sp. CG_S6]
MAGNNPKKTGKAPLKAAPSTPSDLKNGVAVKASFAVLAKYEVNVRVFHPNKNFEKLGFRFHGDNRGFSLGESWFSKKTPNGPTSRIWQRYILDMNLQNTGVKTNDRNIGLETESNFSDSGPSGWKILSYDGEKYENKAYKPRGTLNAAQVETPHGGQKIVRLVSHMAGENHAFLTSTVQQRVFNTTAVPTLDAFSEVFIRLERVELYMDIVSFTYGDGFPNCESFIKDSSGNKLFLGSHVRIGYPATHLWREQKRLIWGNAIRIEIDKDGNFGDKLWIFSQILGGPPDLRDEYPMIGDDEVCSASTKKPITISSLNLINENRGRFLWNCGDPGKILDEKDASKLPLYLSAFNTPLELLRGLIDASWKMGPKKKTTRSEWNDYHLHRDPNAGRAEDDPEYQINEEKWIKIENIRSQKKSTT